jgi:chromosome segregation ATPase
MHQAEVLVKERKHAMEESTRPVREAIRDATRRSRDISLTEEERKVASADVQDLKTELDLLTSEHKEGIEHAQHEISEAKKLMEDSVKEIKGERIKNYADANEQLANTLSIAGHDFSPANRESAAVLRGEKDLKEMFGHIKGKVEHASHDAHAGDHGKKEAHGADAHAKKDDHADGHAH